MNKSKCLLSLIIIAIGITSTIHEANAFEHTTIGAPTCKNWINDKNTPAEKENVIWMNGYFSGLLAVYSYENEMDLLKNEDVTKLLNWTNRYCKIFPNENSSRAAEIYMVEGILKRKLPAHQQ